MTSSSPSPLIDSLTEFHQHSYHWALTCCEHQDSEALDLLQEAYILVLDQQVTYLGKSSLKTWFFGIIKTLAFQNGRRFKRRLALLQTAFSRKHPSLSSPLYSTPSSSVDHQLLYQETQLQVEQALKTLSPRQNRIIHLVFYQGCTLEDCAQILDLSVGSVRTHYARAKTKLASVLKNHHAPLFNSERTSNS